jgi:site-specific recombinase XerD
METLPAIVDRGIALVPTGANKDERHRLGKFQQWLERWIEADRDKRRWYDPDLAAYRDELLAQYQPSSVAAHLSTVRTRYRQIMADNPTRDILYEVARREDPGAGQADLKAMVDEFLTRLENAVNPKAAPVKVGTSQDRADVDQLRLSAVQANALLDAPGVDTLPGLRDTAAIALMLCTGIREAELSALVVDDLRQRLERELALHVREGKGRIERLIPYGDLSWCLAIVDKWHEATGIQDGPVFRGFYKGGHRLRPGRLSVRAVQYILADYPIMVDGKLTTARPHDCRRTYARRLFDEGMAPVAIKQNLGHKRLETTLGYIGTLDAEQRRAPAIYSFDLGKLAKVPIQQRIQAE